MKLLCLNLWGGRQAKPLFDYLKGQAKDTDIFCFQEVFNSPETNLKPDGAHPQLFLELQKLLPDFKGYFSASYKGWIDKRRVKFEVAEGQATFVKNSFKATGHGSIYIYGNTKTAIARNFFNEPKKMQYLKVAVEDKEMLIANAHGKWHPGNKLDTPDRLKQSKIIANFLRSKNLPKILCGDFNLEPETQSIKILNKDFRNLLLEYKILNTRNKISWQQFQNKQHFADYVFTSAEMKVKNFEVPYNEVSDHLPLVLEFSIE